ncbi:hypothetical protein [Aliiglaciecola sp. LCG003]|uniref:hypothetical protein n=1 Tax=Aliiglaciecola sp. LCG003 TaxID=3053655 RepID=UPI002573A63E|nr:hypothetical protein [Aliiglaciecola sp. LCG003]WJG10768.1 hypothetical protein QR722_06950 [Aliiglaciecola sp. LCG003]
MSHIFSQDAVIELGKQYQTQVAPTSRGGCMKAVYIGLGALFGEDFGFKGPFHKSFFRRARRKEIQRGIKEGHLNTIDRVFRALVHEGVVFQEMIFRPTKHGQWQTEDGSQVDGIEQALQQKVKSLADGSHFFGGAISGAIHSILLRVDKSGDEVCIYWMDQFSDGYTAVRRRAFVDNPNVTGKLDRTIRKFGKNSTRLWLLNPLGAIDVGVEIDTDGDGVNDMSVPAVEKS